MLLFIIKKLLRILEQKLKGVEEENEYFNNTVFCCFYILVLP